MSYEPESYGHAANMMKSAIRVWGDNPALQSSLAERYERVKAAAAREGISVPDNYEDYEPGD